MAEVTDEVEGSDLDADAETEVPAVVESESTPCQSEGKESEKGRKILKKVKSALQQNAEKRKRKTSTILVWYYRQGKRKNENKPETDQESLSPTSSNSYQGSEILK
ncbi:uncharacterized protein LOC109488789 [Ailuropoda melanoleuca]|uniref:uncharacterized protein LOC109488789 n=1 Tax=Ailuropoda melanoleuca TaxID=9646 RepID=UPI0009481BC5|nr:uncharacterized protein LOC109488789 [Ailuropoda melanoleuca]